MLCLVSYPRGLCVHACFVAFELYVLLVIYVLRLFRGLQAMLFICGLSATLVIRFALVPLIKQAFSEE